jgi:C1A family cysteine protease
MSSGAAKSLICLLALTILILILANRNGQRPIVDGDVGGLSSNDQPQVSGPSRLFIYYNERSAERHPRCNVPVSLRNGHKTVAKHGACPERHWRYQLGRFSVRPPKHCYEKALVSRVSAYARVVRELKQMKACLADGLPFTMGISIYESFETPAVKKHGLASMPLPHEPLKGGHAVMVVGYRDSKQAFIVRNSWGPQWGIGGYFMLPYEYVLSHKHYAWDFWTILSISSELQRST